MKTGGHTLLTERFVTAVHRYDPGYTDKVKVVVEAIDNELSRQKQFAIADVNRHLDFDGNRCIRMLCRTGFLEALKTGPDAHTVYLHSAAPKKAPRPFAAAFLHLAADTFLPGRHT